MYVWLTGGFRQFFNDMRRGRHIGITHAKVDNVGAIATKLSLAAIDLFKDVRRQAPDFVKFTAHERISNSSEFYEV
jgi:hypothetical protein